MLLCFQFGQGKFVVTNKVESRQVSNGCSDIGSLNKIVPGINTSLFHLSTSTQEQGHLRGGTVNHLTDNQTPVQLDKEL